MLYALIILTFLLLLACAGVYAVIDRLCTLVNEIAQTNDNNVLKVIETLDRLEKNGKTEKNN